MGVSVTKQNVEETQILQWSLKCIMKNLKTKKKSQDTTIPLKTQYRTNIYLICMNAAKVMQKLNKKQKQKRNM